MSSLPRLDDLYKMVAHMYSEQNAQRPARETFAHFVEVCGMLAQNDREKKSEDVSPEGALCKALGWYFPLMAKFKVSSVEDLVFRKFPGACPYCRLSPHDDSYCKTVRGTERTLNHEAVRKLYQQNWKKRPTGLDDWQKMFQRIYPRRLGERGRSTVGLLEELGELAEAVRVFDRYPKYFAGEAADVFSYLMGYANEHALRFERDYGREFSFEDEFLGRYPGLCVQCGYSVCVCPLIPEATVGRLAKELDLGNLQPLFGLDPTTLARDASGTASEVLEKLGGYLGLAERVPFDRGETNRALLLLCLKLADAVQKDNPSVAERLRSAAMKVGNAATYAGNRRRSPEITQLVNSIQATLLGIGPKVDEVVDSACHTLPSQLGLLLKTGQVRVLLVSANPPATDSLRLGAEERAIREAIQLSKYRDAIHLSTLPAARVDDVRRALMSGDYDVVHFCGHGSPSGLIFETGEDSGAEAPLEALSRLFARYPRIKCVVLNTCESLARLISLAPFTVGMQAPVDDEAAVEFARGFYDALAAGRQIEFAVEEGIANVGLKNLQSNFPVRVLTPRDSPS